MLGVEHSGGYATPQWDPDFDPRDPEAQIAMYTACEGFKDSRDIRPETVSCLWIDFKSFVEDNQNSLLTNGEVLSFPVPKDRFNAVLKAFLDHTSRYDTHLALDDNKTSLMFVDAAFTTYEKEDSSGSQLEPYYEKWQELVENINDNSPRTAQCFQTTSTWVRMRTELAFISGTLRSVLISSLCIGVTILVFTRNLLIMTYTLCVIVSVVVALLGYYVMWGWTLGAVESLSVSIVMGLAIDYVLHIGHAFVESKASTRFGKTNHAMIFIGPSVFAASFTTISSMVVLLFCQLYIFNQVGIIVAATLATGIVFCFFCFVPILMIAGPLRKKGDVCHMIRTCRARMRGDVVYDANIEREGVSGTSMKNMDPFLSPGNKTSSRTGSPRSYQPVVSLNSVNAEENTMDDSEYEFSGNPSNFYNRTSIN